MGKTIAFSTLFDSYYLDRGIVLYESLEKVCNDFILYVVLLDDISEKILSSMNYRKMVIISQSEFEDDVLERLKSRKSRSEYCWCCAGYSIRYVMGRFNLESCTYLDADMRFFSDPTPAVTGFLQSDCDVALSPHDFGKNVESNYLQKKFGRYCVQFNSFKSTDNGGRILNWWIDRCINPQSQGDSKESFGDQGYLEEFETRFGGVYEYSDFGMGIAPWNIDKFKLKSDWVLCDKRTRETGKMIFYHFHQLDVSRDGQANLRVFIRPGKHDIETVMTIYQTYISEICHVRKLLNERYGLFEEKEEKFTPTVGIRSILELLACEPNVLFAIRKAFRYLLYKKHDLVRFDV